MSAIEIERVLPAAPTEVFRWLTRPELMSRWMSPRGTASAEADVRVGGRLRVVMREGDIEIEHEGEFVEIDPPRRLAFTWESRYTEGASLVTITLRPHPRPNRFARRIRDGDLDRR